MFEGTLRNHTWRRLRVGNIQPNSYQQPHGGYFMSIELRYCPILEICTQKMSSFAKYTLSFFGKLIQVLSSCANPAPTSSSFDNCIQIPSSYAKCSQLTSSFVNYTHSLPSFVNYIQILSLYVKKSLRHYPPMQLNPLCHRSM